VSKTDFAGRLVLLVYFFIHLHLVLLLFPIIPLTFLNKKEKIFNFFILKTTVLFVIDIFINENRGVTRSMLCVEAQ